MSVKLEDIKRLREATGAGMMDCKKALNAVGGDFEKAIEELRKGGQKVSAKRADREALEGAVIAKISEDKKRGVVVKLSSETDFVSKNEEFVSLTNMIADAAVAAMKPIALDKDHVDSSLVEKEIEIGKEIARQEGKPEAMLEKIALGKLNRFFKDNTLLNQNFVKNNKLSVTQYLASVSPDLTVTDFKHVRLG
ncbi:UNVERIFIED_CONTAM: hypothetical protein GTU68_002089 [Idotea baltica]|nr:hypothetical protein [Idotea baltica]